MHYLDKFLLFKMPVLHVSIHVHHLQGACSPMSYFKILFKVMCIKNLRIQCL
jgi:hypothetical protein